MTILQIPEDGSYFGEGSQGIPVLGGIFEEDV